MPLERPGHSVPRGGEVAPHPTRRRRSGRGSGAGRLGTSGPSASSGDLMPDSNGSAAAAGTVDLGGDITVNRMGFGAMRVTGRGFWGAPDDLHTARAVLRRAVALGVNFIDTADSYGPEVSENLIAEALAPYP